MTTELDDATIEAVAGFVECATYEECRDYLQKHPDLIKKEVCSVFPLFHQRKTHMRDDITCFDSLHQVSDSLFEKGYLVWDSQPHQISARFIRNAQMIQYLLDLRKVSNGQQDITLFFYRIIEDKDKSFRAMFENQVASILKHVEQSWARRRAEAAAKKSASAAADSDSDSDSDDK